MNLAFKGKFGSKRLEGEFTGFFTNGEICATGKIVMMEKEKLKITIDATDGYTWPWAWYLRNFQGVNYPCYGNETGCSIPTEAPDSSVVVVHANNLQNVQQLLDNDFGEGTRIKHRWWFPESYRELTFTKILDGLANRSKWKQAIDYILYRKFATPIGSIDGYVYFSKDLPVPRALDR